MFYAFIIYHKESKDDFNLHQLLQNFIYHYHCIHAPDDDNQHCLNRLQLITIQTTFLFLFLVEDMYHITLFGHRFKTVCLLQNDRLLNHKLSNLGDHSNWVSFYTLKTKERVVE